MTKDAEPRFAMGAGKGFDFGNYRRGWGGAYAAFLCAAREFGVKGHPHLITRWPVPAAGHQDAERGTVLGGGVRHRAGSSP